MKEKPAHEPDFKEVLTGDSEEGLDLLMAALAVSLEQPHNQKVIEKLKESQNVEISGRPDYLS